MQLLLQLVCVSPLLLLLLLLLLQLQNYIVHLCVCVVVCLSVWVVVGYRLQAVTDHSRQSGHRAISEPDRVAAAN